MRSEIIELLNGPDCWQPTPRTDSPTVLQAAVTTAKLDSNPIKSFPGVALSVRALASLERLIVYVTRSNVRRSAFERSRGNGAGRFEVYRGQLYRRFLQH